MFTLFKNLSIKKLNLGISSQESQENDVHFTPPQAVDTTTTTYQSITNLDHTEDIIEQTLSQNSHHSSSPSIFNLLQDQVQFSFPASFRPFPSSH